MIDPDGGETRIVKALTSSSAWRGAGSGRVVKAHKASVAGFALGDGLPMINLTDPLGACTGSCIAASLSSYSERFAGSGSYRIQDHDVITNTAVSWTSGGEDPGLLGCASEHYVESIMVHEVGHGLGLGHSTTAGATMSALTSFCNQGPMTTEADDEAGIVALDGTSPAADRDPFTNYITGTAITQYQPCGASFVSAAGTLNGHVRAPAGTDFNLFLWKFVVDHWSLVALSANAGSSTEDISYAATAGTYRWGVRSSNGAGQYHFYSDQP